MGAHLWRSDQLSLPYQSLTVWLYWFEPYLPGGGRVQYSEAKEKTRCNRQSPWPAFHSLTPLVALFLLLRQQEMPPVRCSVHSLLKCNTVVSHQLHCIVEHSTAQHTIFQCCFQSVLFCIASRYCGTECNALKTFSWMECSSASNFDQVLRFCGEHYPTLLSPLASAQRPKHEKKWCPELVLGQRTF